MKSVRISNHRRALLLCVASTIPVALPGVASAESPRLHVMAGGARALGGPQQDELGPGGGGTVAGEYTFGRHFGIQAEAGALILSHIARPADPHVADRGTAVVISGMAGVRFGVGGAWIDANGGVAQSGVTVHPAFDTHVGFDFRPTKTSAWTMGPFLGYTQVFQSADALRPDDAHVAWIGMHVSFGGDRPVPIIPIAKAAPPPVRHVEVAKIPEPSDRDHDEIVDAEDACPDVVGPRTDDPSTNGCPPSSIHLVGDRIELDDVIRFDTGSAVVKRASWSAIQKIAQYIIDRGDITAIDIEGHADERGTDEYNQHLSEERAQSVQKLLERFGVSGAVMARGFGESRPRTPGNLDANRRVEFFVTRTQPVKDEPKDEGHHASN